MSRVDGIPWRDRRECYRSSTSWVPGAAPENHFHRIVYVLTSDQNVSIDHEPRCDCADFLKGNVPCEHLIYIL